MITGTLRRLFRSRTIDRPSSSGMLRSSTIEIGHAALDLLAQALAAVAQGHGEAVHLQIVADHLAGGRLVIDDNDVLALAHASRIFSLASFGGCRQRDGEGRALARSGAVRPSPCRHAYQQSVSRSTARGPSSFRHRSAWQKAAENGRKDGRDPPATGPGPGRARGSGRSRHPRRPSISILPPIGLYLIALLTRLSIASRIRSPSHMTCARARPTTVRSSAACSRPAAGSSRRSPCTSAREVHRLAADRDVERVGHRVRDQMSTICVSRLVASRMWSTCDEAAFLRRHRAADQLFQHFGPAENDARADSSGRARPCRASRS